MNPIDELRRTIRRPMDPERRSTTLAWSTSTSCLVVEPPRGLLVSIEAIAVLPSR